MLPSLIYDKIHAMSVIFDGTGHAEPIFDGLSNRVRDLKENYEITPHLVVFMIGVPPGGEIYTQRKKAATERIGAKFTLVQFPESASVNEIIESINKFNQDEKAHGILVQLPLPQKLLYSKFSILNSISPDKDIDGLLENNKFAHPTSQAILDILENSLITTSETKILLIGSLGFVGGKTLQLIKSHDFTVTGIDREITDLTPETLKADVIISATGTPNLIDQSMVKKDVNIIDIGYPAGDINPDVSQKAKFMTLIKNGVGPLTIAYLLDNLVNAAYNTITTHT